MNLRRLNLFLQVASEGSLSRAARSCGVAQPALTRQIQLLEAEVGERLFERLPRGLRLTEAGEYLREALEVPLNEIETAIGNVRSFSKHLKASLSIGFPPMIAKVIGARIVLRLRNELPNIALRVVEADSIKLGYDLSRRVLDVAILVSTMPEQQVSQVQVLSETLNLVGSAKHPVFQRDSIRFRELENLPIVMPSLQSGLHAILSRRASAAGLRLAPFMECASSDLAMQMLHEEEMYCLMPERVYREEMAEGRIAAIPIIEPELTMPVFWAVKPDWRLPRALYNELERVVFEEWYDAVASGVWPAEWIFDLNALSLPFRPRLATPDDPRS